MTLLADIIRPRGTFVRSANLERDTDGGRPRDYTPTARSLDLLQRVMDGWADPSRSRAWSVVGPYGSGKSSIALILDGLLGPVSSQGFRAAVEAIESIDPRLAASVASVHDSNATRDRGFIRAFATADPEPATTSVLRAVQRGTTRYWPRGRKPAVVDAITTALAAADNGTQIAPTRLVSLLKELTGYAPLMLVVDEFGKNLDFLRDEHAGGDLYVMQALAEAAVGDSARLGVMTIQHMTFDDYSATASVEQRREWAKVQGRFEEVLFLDSSDQTLSLMSHVFEATWPEDDTKRIQAWAKAGTESLRGVGLADRIPDSSLIEAMFPLHPLAAIALPDLCRRYGQNERTLFSFLTHDEPGAVGEFLARVELPTRGALPVVRLTALFDYFVGSVTPALGASPESARWFEIHDRISQAVGLSNAEEEVLKTVGILNLIAQGGALRASTDVISYALRPAAWIRGKGEVPATLKSLERRGFLTYRAFADEYRLWQGSDFDLEGRLAMARRNYAEVPLRELLPHVAPLSPVIASRHAQERGIVRSFTRELVDSDDGHLRELVRDDAEADGFIFYVAEGLPLQLGGVERPVVIIEVPDLGSVRQLLGEAAAAADVVRAGDIDWVAQREMEERAALASQHVREALDAVLHTSRRSSLLLKDGHQWLPVAKSVSEVASMAADRAYSAAPHVRNEMLGRAALTSQAARARLDLLTAMVAAPTVERLGIEGYGPDRALYEAILAREKLHRFDGEAWAFAQPSADSSFAGAWTVIDQKLREDSVGPVTVAEIERELGRPPIGVKPPLVPILLTAYLQSIPDQIAIYQDGTFQPRLSPELLERLTKAPARFSLRHMTVEGQRAEVLRALARQFGLVIKTSGARHAAPVLSIVGPLLETIRQMPEFTLHAARLSDTTSAVRVSLLSAREPDQLLFVDLPAALGLPPVNSGPASGATAGDYASRMHAAMAEMAGAYPTLLRMISEELAEGLSLHGGNSLKAEAAARARPLLTQVADPRLRAVLFALTSDALDDEDWLEAVGLAISERPPRMWREEEVNRFPGAARGLLSAFRRVEALHFEIRAVPADGFIARRVTVTAPDGTESSRVVWIDESDVASMRKALTAALGSLSGDSMSAGNDALLAAMAELLLPGDTSDEEESKVAKSRREERASGQ